jgi:hypothetical protein
MTPEAPGRVAALLQSRRADLLGGEDSIGVQEASVAELQSRLDAAVAHLNACRAEVAEIDAALTILVDAMPGGEVAP